jgi:hypothetical protein
MTRIPHPFAPGRRYTARMRKRHARDDLFSIFPDLPRPRHRTRTSRTERVERHVAQARLRVGQNILRQWQPTERVRTVIARRRLR